MIKPTELILDATFLLVLSSLLVESSRLSLPDPVREVINQTLPSVTGGMALTELNRDFLRRHKTSLDHVFSGTAMPPCRHAV